MHVGLLTAPFPTTMAFADIAQWAASAGFSALEVSSGEGRHLDPAVVMADGGAGVRAILARTGLRISALEFYRGIDYQAPQVYQQQMRELIAMAGAVGAPLICTFAGFAGPGKSKERTIREDLPAVFSPLAEAAAKRGIGIAFENWFQTNLQHLGHFRALIQALPQPNVGFNLDPSHLHWQGIDYLSAVEEFKGRILHTHAKDVAVDQARRALSSASSRRAGGNTSSPATASSPGASGCASCRCMASTVCSPSSTRTGPSARRTASSAGSTT